MLSEFDDIIIYMEQELKKLGLSENEAKAYLAALSFGPETATNIAKHSSIKRSTTYLALENLIKLGLVSQELVNKKRLFRAEDPDKLRNLVKKMRRQVIAAEIKLDEVIPEIKAIKNREVEAPKVSLFHGLEGVKSVLEMISENEHSWYFFGAGKEIINSIPFEELSDLMISTDKLREKAGRPKTYLITDEGISKLKHFQTKKPSIREIKILSETIKSKSALIIFENGIAVLNFSESPFGVVIQNKEIAEVVKIMYLNMWNNLKDFIV